MKRGFRGAPRPLLPAMLLVATTNPSAGQEHPDVAQSQPSSSTQLYTRLRNHLLHTNTSHPHKSMLQRQDEVDDLLQLVPQLMTSKLIVGKGSQVNQDDNGVHVKLVKKVKKLEDFVTAFREDQVNGKLDYNRMQLKLSPGCFLKASSIDKGGGGASLTEAIRLDNLEKEEEANKYTWILFSHKGLQKRRLMSNKARRAQVESFTPINFEATKDNLKRVGEELQTETSKRLKSDEAKVDESTKKTRKRRKQIARKGLT
ncbi:hypothetical protein Tco_1124373 [Tanacetum coccineum]|uniref:Uncharacterized protein n=1 Tax=Tanacetum coccineum TaxID=301880 RepID=A0ABQ5J607_9ASTR